MIFVSLWFIRLSPFNHRLPSTVYRLPSTVYRLPSTVYRLPSTVYRLPSVTVQKPEHAINHQAGTLFRDPMAGVLHPLHPQVRDPAFQAIR